MVSIYVYNMKGFFLFVCFILLMMMNIYVDECKLFYLPSEQLSVGL